MPTSLDVRDLRKQFGTGRPAVDGVSCKTIAGYAMRTFPPVVPRIVCAEAVQADVARGEVVQGEIVPD